VIESNKANPKRQCAASWVTYFPAKKYNGWQWVQLY